MKICCNICESVIPEDKWPTAINNVKMFICSCEHRLRLTYVPYLGLDGLLHANILVASNYLWDDHGNMVEQL